MTFDISTAVDAMDASCVQIAEPVFVFGIHKCGSTLLHQMVAQVCARAKLPKLNIPGLASEQGIKGKIWASDPSLVPIFQQSCVFYGFRFFPEVLRHPALNIRDRKFVLLVRDPRDALVSEFFSYGGKHASHVLPEKRKEAVLENMSRTADLDIDQYVLHVSTILVEKMVEYREGLDFSKGLLRRYEDVYFDKFAFLRDIFEYFGIEVNQAVLRKVAEANDVRPDREDITKHVRKGTPGDYADKLKPETIAQLNDLFGGVAAAYGYGMVKGR